MTDGVSPLEVNRAKNYLVLSSEYCRGLGGVRWSDHEDALVYPDGRFFAFNEALAFLLEGFAGAGRLVHFCHLVHFVDLVLDARHQNTPEVTRLRHLFFGSGGFWRNAGALAGVLCKAVPGVAEPPRVELVLNRLRDRTFPIRYYVREYNEAELDLEQPPLGPAEFQEQILATTILYTDEELRSWFHHGRGPVKEAGQTIAQESPPPRSLLAALAALLERPRLAGAETYVMQLVGALALPPRRLTPQELPVGGYADMTNHGGFEAILPSQFALDELEFFRRFAERELLYFRREEPPAQNKHELVVLLDQGVRTWGDVRLVLSAAAIALGKQAARHKTPFSLSTTSIDGRLVVPHETEPEELGRLVETSDLTPHPALALERVLEQPVAVPRDIVLLTHPRNAAETDVRHAALRLGARDRLFTVTLAGDGQAQMNELRHGAPVKIRQFRVGFEPASRPPEPAPGIGWAGQVEPIPFPFHFGADSFIGYCDFDYEGERFVTASREGMLHAWKTDGGHIEILPRAFHLQRVLRHVQGMIGVAGGVVVAGYIEGNLLVVHYDFNKRRASIYPFAQAIQATLSVAYSRKHHAVVCRNLAYSHAFSIDLESGLTYSSEAGGPPSRAKEAWQEHERGLAGHRILPLLAGKKDKPQRGLFFDTASGTLEVADGERSWPAFVPLADGVPMLSGAGIQTAQMASGTLVLKVQRAQKPISLLVLHGPLGRVFAEYPMASHKYQFQLAQDGAWLAKQVSDSNFEVRSIYEPHNVFATRAGGSSHQVRLHLGNRQFLLALGDTHRHWIGWETGTLEIIYDRGAAGVTQRVIEKWRALASAVEAGARTPVRGFNYDPRRFVAGVQGHGLIFLADRFGQVAVLDQEGQVVAMFMAFRDRGAAWLPDGTQDGSPQLLTGPPTPAAAEKIGAALLAASR